MRSILIILFSFFAFVFAKAQMVCVGDTSCNYVIANRNFSVTCYYPSNPWSASIGADSLEIDVDGDLMKDLSIYSYCIWNGGGSSSNSTFYVKVISLNNKTQFAFQTPSLGFGCSYSSTVANLSWGAPLDASLSWSISPTTPPPLNGPSPFVYYSYSSPISSSWSCGNVGQFYMGVRKINTGDTIKGWVLLNAGSPGSVTSYAFKHTLNTNTVTPVFTGTVNEVCFGGTVALSAGPSGGVYSGLGVSGNTFNSVIPGSGVQNVYYTVGCSAPAIKSITVHPSPSIVFTNTQTSVCSGYSLALTANPSGGTFSGTGVSGTTFNSSSSGTTIISYSYTDGFGCSNTKTLSVNSVTAPILSAASTSSFSCPAESVTLSVNGADSYTWSTGAQTTSVIVNPTSATIYTVTGEFSGGSCPISTITFTQSAGNPTVTVTGPAVGCPNSLTILSASGAASYSWSTGDNIYLAGVTPTVTTSYSVVGSINGGTCSDTAYYTQVIDPPPSISISPNTTTVCPWGTIQLMVIGGNGPSYSVADSLNPSTTTTLIASNPIPLTVMNSITYKIGIWYGTNSCETYVYFHQDVLPCVGINEITGGGAQFKISPNPNNGEFEIKGTKEETVFISNELGQLVDKKKLTPENNYSVKLNDLQSGVYFVGNKFYRQKVVVIKN
jgi:hypothetical protein